MDLDTEVKNAIAHLEQLQGEHIEQLVRDADNIRRQYPESFLKKTAIALAEKQLKLNDEHINSHRTKYNNLKSFKEKKEYYETTLRLRELGYQVSTQKIQNFLAEPNVKPYEAWVSEVTYENMKRKGFEAVVLDELLYGNLT